MLSSRVRRAAVILVACVVGPAAVTGCSNVIVLGEHPEVAQPYVEGSYQPSWEADEEARAAQRAECETVKTVATMDAALSSVVAVASLASGRHHRSAAHHVVRAASDLPAATMRCPSR